MEEEVTFMKYICGDLEEGNFQNAISSVGLFKTTMKMKN